MTRLLFIFIALVFVGCEQEPQVRHYTEIVIEPSQQAEPGKLLWDVPAGWSQEAGNAMRLASFHAIVDPKAIDCSIVSLGGMAGGIEANLTRWMKQIGLEVPDDEFDAFVRSAKAMTTKAGVAAAVYDFTKLQKGADGSTQSIMAAVLHLGDATVFVKMTGSATALKAHHPQFLALVQSIREP